jgi:hypothetical protein
MENKRAEQLPVWGIGVRGRGEDVVRVYRRVNMVQIL